MKFLKALMLSAVMVSSAFAVDLDTTKSVINWEASKITGKHHGKVPMKSGNLEMKDGKVVGGKFVASIADFTVEDLSGEWATKFITHMKSEDFFEVKKYPVATMKIKSVKNGKATGDLTIKGKTNEVTFDMKESKGAYIGTLKFDRTKFDMIYGSKDFFKNIGDKAIHNEVVLNYKLVLKK